MEGYIPIDEQIAAVRRELAMRAKVYPRWVSQGKLSQDNADAEVARMQAVLATLERVDRGEQRDHPELHEVRQLAYARALLLFAPFVHTSRWLRFKAELEGRP